MPLRDLLPLLLLLLLLWLVPVSAWRQGWAAQDWRSDMRFGTLTDSGIYTSRHNTPPPTGYGKVDVEYVKGWEEWGCRRHRFKWRIVNGTFPEYIHFADFFNEWNRWKWTQPCNSNVAHWPVVGNESWWYSDASNWHGEMRWRVFSRKIWHIMEHFYDSGWDVEWHNPPEYYVRWKKWADEKRKKKEWQQRALNKAVVDKLQRDREQQRREALEMLKLQEKQREEEEEGKREELGGEKVKGQEDGEVEVNQEEIMLKVLNVTEAMGIGLQDNPGLLETLLEELKRQEDRKRKKAMEEGAKQG